MIGRLCIVDQGKRQWVGRVVHVALSPRAVIRLDSDVDYPKVLPESWEFIVEDEDGKLYHFSLGKVTHVLPEGSDKPLGWISQRDGGDS